MKIIRTTSTRNIFSFKSKLIRNLLVGLLFVTIISYLATAPPFIKPVYKSEALIFVPLIILSKQIEQQGIGFASDREIDAHIQILESGQLKDSLIERFRLDETFGIDPDALGGRNQLHKILDNRIKIQKTRFSSLSIQVIDTDPARAAEIANTIIDLGNIIKEAVLFANRKGAEAYARSLYESKIKEILDIESRIEALNDMDPKAQVQTELSKLQTLYGAGLQELMGRKNHWERELKSLETELPKAYVISSAITDANPSSPNRKLITIACFILYLFAASVILILKRDVKLVYKKD